MQCPSRNAYKKLFYDFYISSYISPSMTGLICEYSSQGIILIFCKSSTGLS